VRTGNWFRFESDREMKLSKLTTTKNIALPPSFSKWGRRTCSPHGPNPFADSCNNPNPLISIKNQK
jgi:hypothetical protein